MISFYRERKAGIKLWKVIDNKKKWGTLSMFPTVVASSPDYAYLLYY
jgi:hypothetical protein